MRLQTLQAYMSGRIDNNMSGDIYNALASKFVHINGQPHEANESASYPMTCQV
jgi:hypothetical protein